MGATKKLDATTHSRQQPSYRVNRQAGKSIKNGKNIQEPHDTTAHRLYENEKNDLTLPEPSQCIGKHQKKKGIPQYEPHRPPQWNCKDWLRSSRFNIGDHTHIPTGFESPGAFCAPTPGPPADQHDLLGCLVFFSVGLIDCRVRLT